MYFCEKRELNCLKRLILQRIIYIILMDSNNLTPLRKGVVGVQFLFVAFGATVLVPLLVGLDPSTALFTAGIGTLIFHAVTRGKVPVFLGSSFAFIAPIIKATELYGLPGTLSGSRIHHIDITNMLYHRSNRYRNHKQHRFPRKLRENKLRQTNPCRISDTG